MWDYLYVKIQNTSLEEPYKDILPAGGGPRKCGCGSKREYHMEIYKACSNPEKEICDLTSGSLTRAIILHPGRNVIVMDIPNEESEC